MPLADQDILDYIADHPRAGREAIRRHVAPQASAPTVWRALKRLVEQGRLEVTEKARATGYSLAGPSVVRAHLRTPYNRRRPAFYNESSVPSQSLIQVRSTILCRPDLSPVTLRWRDILLRGFSQPLDNATLPP